MSRDKVRLIGSQWRSAPSQGIDGRCWRNVQGIDIAQRRKDTIAFPWRSATGHWGAARATLQQVRCRESKAMLWGFMISLIQGVSNTQDLKHSGKDVQDDSQSLKVGNVFVLASPESSVSPSLCFPATKEENTLCVIRRDEEPSRSGTQVALVHELRKVKFHR